MWKTKFRTHPKEVKIFLYNLFFNCLARVRKRSFEMKILMFVARLHLWAIMTAHRLGNYTHVLPSLRQNRSYNSQLACRRFIERIPEQVTLSAFRARITDLVYSTSRLMWGPPQQRRAKCREVSSHSAETAVVCYFVGSELRRYILSILTSYSTLLLI
jgi:hypothetical protein